MTEQTIPSKTSTAFLFGLFSITKQEVPAYGDTIIDEKGYHWEQVGTCQENRLDILEGTRFHKHLSLYTNHKEFN